MQPLYLWSVFRSNLEIMKNLVSMLALVFFSTLVIAQGETRSVGAFSGVKSAEGISVYLKKGDKESVRVVVTGTTPDKVVTEVSGTYLKVHMKDTGHKGNIEAKVYVTYVKLDKLSASSAGSIFTEGSLSTPSLDVSVSSAGTIEISVETGNLSVEASSAGEIELSGKAKSLTASSSSAGEIDAYDLEAGSVTAEANSAGSIKVNVTGELNAEANSGGSVRYRGNPSKSITNSNSGGSVKKSN